MSEYNSPPVGSNSANSNLKTEEQKSNEFPTNKGTHIAQQDDKNNIQTKKQDKLRSDKGSFKIGSRSVKKPTQEELDAAKGISKAAKKEGWKIKIPAIILGALGAIVSVAAAIATCGAAPLIGLAVAALVVGGGVIAGNRRESGTQAAYAETEQRQRETFQLEDDQTAAERFQDVQVFIKEKKAQEKAEKKAAKKNFNAKEFSEGLNEAWTKKVPNNTGQPAAPTLQEIQNARQNLGSSMRGISQQPASMLESSPLAPKPEQKNTQPPAPGSQRIPQRRGSPRPDMPQNWSVADKGTTEIKPKFSNETLATLDNIATFLEKETADITEEEFVETLQFGSTEVRDVYTAAKNQELLTKDLLSKLVDKQKECYKDSESGSGSLTEQINTFKKACSEQKISDEAIDAVFKEVEGLEKQDKTVAILNKIRDAALTKINKAGGIKGADGKVLISGDALNKIFNEAVKLRQAAIGNDIRQIKSDTVSLKELTDELEINTLILSEESDSAKGIEKLNGAILNITSGEGDSQQITLSVRDSKVFYKTTPNDEEKELDEAGKKHIQNALVFNGINDKNSLGNNEDMITPLDLKTKKTLLSDIDKAQIDADYAEAMSLLNQYLDGNTTTSAVSNAEPVKTAAKPTHKNDTIGDHDDEIGDGDLTKSTASEDASEVDGKSVDATEDELSFDELVSQAEGKQLITEYGTSKFVSLKKLDIKNFTDIEPDGSNLPAESRPMYLAYKNQGKKFGDELVAPSLN